ncbi:3535_t:CDS:2, partial [Acaulospora morrowiae]
VLGKEACMDFIGKRGKIRNQYKFIISPSEVLSHGKGIASSANNKPTSSDDYLDEFLEEPNTAWLTSHENENLPTSIYKNSNLPSDNR